MKRPLPARPPEGDNAALPLEQCLAKSWEKGEGIAPGRTVEEHCCIAGAVASSLAARLERVRSGLLPAHAALPAQVHDVGKVCPTFQAKLYDAILGRDVRRRYPALRGAEPDLERNWGGHAAVSYAALKSMGAPESIARIAGEHHGMPLHAQSADRPGYGGARWEAARRELLHRLLGNSPDWPELGDAALERVVSGLTITADWIASGPLCDNPAEDWRPLVERAVDEGGFCWPGVKKGLSFADIFSFSPRPAQKALYAAVTGPGAYVLEAPMGLGKTEAALYAAYRMLEVGASCGIYFALPTRLTSNRIHQRVDAFLSRILEKDAHALLLHGTAWLERFLHQELGREGAPNHSWFAQGKRGILAPFAVGTVDQALLSAMHVRHGALRTFGLAGKTVILDEIHSYDAYTGTILDFLVEQLRRIGCTVIILSATLTEDRRGRIIGRNIQARAYPLISAVPQSGEAVAVACEGPVSSCVLLGHPATEDAAVEEALRRAEQGQRVLWIENTVAHAQERFCRLAARAAAMSPLPTGLLHSRFTPVDRADNENRWTAFFARDATDRGRLGGILVGTQVVEQSLDLDADFLISSFCPTDMLLQRLGRLWRHGDGTCRSAPARREAWILHPGLEEALAAPRKSFGASAHVYAPYILCRSLELWHTLDRIRLPEDIRAILEATYADRRETDGPMAAAWHALCAQRDELRAQAMRSVSTSTSASDDDDSHTRINQRKELSVLLLRAWRPEARYLVLADGGELNLISRRAAPHAERNGNGDKGRRWRERAAAAALLARNTVRVPEHLAPESMPPSWLAEWMYCGDLRLALLDKDGVILRLDGGFPQHAVRYDAEQGYMEWLPYAQE